MNWLTAKIPRFSRARFMEAVRSSFPPPGKWKVLQHLWRGNFALGGKLHHSTRYTPTILLDIYNYYLSTTNIAIIFTYFAQTQASRSTLSSWTTNLEVERTTICSTMTSSPSRARQSRPRNKLHQHKHQLKFKHPRQSPHQLRNLKSQ